MMPFASQKVAAQLQQWLGEATRRRNEHFIQRIDETLGEDEVGLLLVNERHQLQFPQDIEVFYVAPPALDEYRRWVEGYVARQRAAQAEAMAAEGGDGEDLEEGRIGGKGVPATGRVHLGGECATGGTGEQGRCAANGWTRKGAFILYSGPERKDWRLSGPHIPGSDVFHMTYDARRGEVFAASNHMVWGPQLEFSRDLGGTWEQPKEQPRFSPDAGATVNRLWHIEPGLKAEPEVLYMGVEPAALFKSEDGGSTWNEVRGLSDHPTRAEWQPGFGGLCLHSIALDATQPESLWVGISAAGVFRSDDGGKTWETANRGVRADFSPEDRYPEWGQCPHKVLAHPLKPGLLYQQNHCGVYRSDDGGANWADLTEGLPSAFGFVLGLHPHDTDTLFVLPEDEALGTDVGGGLRYVSGGKCRVFRSKSGGQSWEPLTNGLPQEHAYVHALREGMTTDHLDPVGVYLGHHRRADLLQP